LVGLVWGTVVVPSINDLIDKKQVPILDVLEYQNCLMMATMNDSTMKKAEYLYKISKGGRAAK
jgi:hypothetical protein